VEEKLFEETLKKGPLSQWFLSLRKWQTKLRSPKSYFAPIVCSRIPRQEVRPGINLLLRKFRKQMFSELPGSRIINLKKRPCKSSATTSDYETLSAIVGLLTEARLVISKHLLHVATTQHVDKGTLISTLCFIYVNNIPKRLLRVTYN
jgi:hypothetical protein